MSEGSGDPGLFEISPNVPSMPDEISKKQARAVEKREAR